MRQAKLGTKASEETRALLSEIRQNHPVSNETRDKISNSRLEMEFTEEHCKNMSESRKGFKHSQETIDSISGSNAFNSISIIDTNTGKEYSSITEVSKDLNLSHGTIEYRLRKGTFGLIRKDNKPKKKSKRIQGPDNTVYESIHEAQRITGRSRSTIRGWLKNPKMNWKYLE